VRRGARFLRPRVQTIPGSPPPRPSTTKVEVGLNHLPSVYGRTRAEYRIPIAVIALVVVVVAVTFGGAISSLAGITANRV
jgi:hypothetical protein